MNGSGGSGDKVVRLDVIRAVSREVKPAFTAIVRETIGKLPTPGWEAVSCGDSTPWWQEVVRIAEAKEYGADRAEARARFLAFAALLFDATWDRAAHTRVAPRLFARMQRAARGIGA